MIMDEVLDRFLQSAPVAVMVRASLAHVFDDTAMDNLFERYADSQYTRSLTFSTVVKLMSKLVFGVHDAVHAAYRHTANIPVSITAVYDKLNGLETGISEGLVRETGQSIADVIAALPVPQADVISGLRLRTLDGNFLAGTDHRLDCLRGSGAAALPGMSLVVRDGRTGVLTDQIACEDAYTNERSLFPRLLTLVQANDLWLADRNFCTNDYMSGIAERQAYFLIRHHLGTMLHPLEKERYVGHNPSGDLYEQRVRVGGLTCRCIIIRLFKPLRDGSTEMRLLTNVPTSKAGAKRLAEIYHTRWKIETAFQELTENLRCEINTLGYPKSALFAFALAITAYNVLVLVRQVLDSEWPRKQKKMELSSYHLATEVATVSDGLAIAVAEKTWEQFASMSTARFVQWLLLVAKGVDRKRYRKNPRGPKKPTEIKRTRRGAHRSTARELQNHD
jgi:IS4 transposase